MKKGGTPVCVAIAESNSKQLSVSFLLNKRFLSVNKVFLYEEIFFFVF